MGSYLSHWRLGGYSTVKALKHRVIGEVMRAIHRKRARELPYEEPSRITLLDGPVPANDSEPIRTVGNAIRWVTIAGKVFGVTPKTCYKGILDNGTDYYPYYDDNLHDASTTAVRNHIHDLITGLGSDNADRVL